MQPYIRIPGAGGETMPEVRQDGRIAVGVAGWAYDDWKGTVYPKPSPSGFDPVRYLAAYIDLIEINTTFYAPAKPDVAERWAGRVADLDGFRYTAKLWRRFTHERDEAWTRAEADKAKDGFRPLADAGRLDAVLIQFPWSFKNDDASREWLGDVVDEFRDFPLVVEVRHESWNEPGFYAWLADEDVGFVNIDQPLFRRSIRPSARTTARRGYIRVHGRNYRDWWRKGARDARYDYLYQPDDLKPWVDRAREVAGDPETDHVDVVFNNHREGKAVVNAIEFRKLIHERRVPAPPTLMEAYAKELAGYARPQPVAQARDAAD